MFKIIAIATFIFCLAIAFDISPYLRGPAPYPPDWQWSYYFVNTLHKIYPALLLSVFLVGAYIQLEKKNTFIKKRTIVFLCSMMILCFLFQLSILFFSRSDIPVLLHRIINPELNGYFTASLTIQNVATFLRDYNDIMLDFVYHAKSHPPGAILLFYFLKQLIIPFTFLIEFANSLTPSHSDVKQVWDVLLPVDKATALVSAFFIPFLSTVSLVPLYYSAKILYGPKVALRSTFLFFFIPAIVFFIPINDAFLHIFSVSSFFFLLYGLVNKHLFSFFVSGAILFMGVFFNLSLLPVLILLCVFAIIYLLNNKRSLSEYLKGGSSFSVGFFLPVLLLYLFFQFNFLEIIHTITTHAPGNLGRSYAVWIYFNIQDFLIFCGIPVSLIFMLTIKKHFSQFYRKQFSKIDPLFLSFFLMILILNFSGFVLGETGRIWLPYFPFMVLITAGFMTNKLKFSTKLFAGILTLQIIQIVVMQEFWVMLW